MSSAKRIFELQQVEQAIQIKLKSLDDLNHQLTHNEAFEKARTGLADATRNQAEIEKQYKELDWEAEEIRRNLIPINDKLYSGKIKNPKELVGYEQEAGMLKSRLGKKDDVLLDLMEKIEVGKNALNVLREKFTEAERTWQKEQQNLRGQIETLKSELSDLESKHAEALSAVDREGLTSYENIKKTRGQAVVRVEQGRCLGCRVMLSVSELQRVRGGTIVTCSNCGRILYLS
jgi:predicted  nucleic acid-binding Zn-ribbon protein